MSADVNQIIIPMYIESAQLYLQLSIGAIGLSVAFKEKILGEQHTKSVSLILAMSWLLFLATIALSAFYQYIAVKFLDKELDPTVVVKYFTGFVNEPGHIYGAMLFTFFFGAFLLVISSTFDLLGSKRG